MHTHKVSQKELHKLSFSLLWMLPPGSTSSWGEEETVYIFNAFKHQIKSEISIELYLPFPVMMLNVIVRESSSLRGRSQLSLVQEVVQGLLGMTHWQSD